MPRGDGVQGGSEREPLVVPPHWRHRVFLCRGLCVGIYQHAWVSAHWRIMCMLVGALSVSMYLSFVVCSCENFFVKCMYVFNVYFLVCLYMKTVYFLVCLYTKTLRPINIKQGKTTNPNNSFFLEKKKAARVGFEPTAHCLLGRCSNH